jgi:heme ABC exporter ATP-binding subunit CcmA
VSEDEVPSIGENLAIEVGGLSKTFGLRPALRGIDLKVREGDFVTVFGPNGAGKTTLIRILATLSKPTSGRVLMDGLDLAESGIEVRRRIGVVTHQTLLYGDLTGYENLKFYGRMFDVPNLEERIQEVGALVGLSARLGDRARTLSRGMQQRLSLARSIIHHPSIMLLDEPETGLDQDAMAILENLVRQEDGRRRTVMMTTHSLERGLRMGEQIIILSDGRIVYQEAKQALDVGEFAGTYAQYTGGHR